MSTKVTSASIIPVLDLQPLLDGDEAGVRTLAAELKQALQDIGFFSIINHGVSWQLVEQIYEATQTLHSLPQEQKDAITMDRTHGGYLGMGAGTSYASEIAGDVRKPNQNEAFSFTKVVTGKRTNIRTFKVSKNSLLPIYSGNAGTSRLSLTATSSFTRPGT